MQIHEDLLQSGKRGGIVAAHRLRDEVLEHIQHLSDTSSWQIMVQLYIDIGGILARCVGNDIPMSDSSVRDFMLGFTQPQPLFTIVEVGYDSGQVTRKVEGMTDKLRCCLILTVNSNVSPLREQCPMQTHSIRLLS